MSGKAVLASSLVALTFLTACQRDETVSAYGAADKVWRLMSIDDVPFTASATLTFPDPGTIAGEAPCNTYSTTMTVPYPWFEAGPIMTTRRTCPDQQSEDLFLKTMSEMTLSEVLGNTMILSTPDGSLMLFKADA